ncbi:EpsG family protein [Thalassotalea nanhaiensis]|uniref:EpsG family protein n=1 Tax=Thalassotalea nanhaiensis TaxID=3065648 RepID=A0ABY9TLF3_9GAMM|nr:EpsG family protein [Colwelliaceae bacterium SQ345]
MKKNNIIAILLYPVSPASGVIYSSVSLGPLHIINLLFVSLFAGFCAYNVIPYAGMDIVVYYIKYKEIEFLPIERLSEYYQVNLGVTYLLKLMQLAGLSKEFVPFLITFISYFTFLYSVKVLAPKKDVDKFNINSIYILFLAIFVISFIANAIGIRSGLSTSIFCLSIAYYLKGDKVKFSFLAIISVLVHVYIILPLCLIFFVKFLSIRTVRIMVLISPVLAVLGLGELIAVQTVPLVFPPEISDYILNVYVLSDRYGVNAELSYKTQIVLFFFVSLPFYMTWFFAATCKLDNVIIKLIGCLIIFVFTFWDLFILVDRYKYLIQMLMAIVLFFSILKNKENLNYIHYFFLFTCFISSCWGVFRYKVLIASSYDIVYKPFFFLFSNDVNINNLQVIAN